MIRDVKKRNELKKTQVFCPKIAQIRFKDI